MTRQKENKSPHDGGSQQPPNLKEKLPLPRNSRGDIKWDNIITNGDSLRTIFLHVGKAENKPASLVTATDLNTHGMFRPYQIVHTALKKANKNADPMFHLHEIAGLTSTTEDVLSLLQTSNSITWPLVSKEAQRGLLERLAKELGKPVILLDGYDFRKKLPLLGERSLYGYYHYINKLTKKGREESNKDSIEIIIERLGINITTPDVIKGLKTQDKFYRWAIVPQKTLHEILTLLAEERRKPIFALTNLDLTEYKPHFLEERKTLESLKSYAKKNKEAGQSIFGFIFEHAGIQLSFQDIQTIFQRKDSSCRWNLVPPQTLHYIFEEISVETGKPQLLIAGYDLCQPFDCINNHTFVGLLEYAQKQERNRDETPIAWLKKKAGIPHENGKSADFINYRRRRMQELFQEYQTHSNRNISKAKDYLPWIFSVSKLYKRPYLDIAEVQNELFLYISDLLIHPLSKKDIVQRAHTFIEKYANNTFTRRHREKLLSTKIGDNYTLQDELSNKISSPGNENLIFSSRIEQALLKLSPLQKALIIGAAIDKWNIDDIANEINREKAKYNVDEDVSADLLEELLHEAQLTLQIELNEDTDE